MPHLAFPTHPPFFFLQVAFNSHALSLSFFSFFFPFFSFPSNFFDLSIPFSSFVFYYYYHTWREIIIIIIQTKKKRERGWERESEYTLWWCVSSV
ncbi:hypothetical protein BDA99DRAFT_117300 [Phascolomyces articulosus]|uniref:Uncharacterized protein n=1 Tax=Phascolomyces articulosus TaxID=60185 RepID=A0AAD5KNZ4_9FUNG|nr:hypothetical protein BDA99DRAFT_117300 [Phascolomyces articulosus]